MTTPIRYPRRVWIRTLLRWIARLGFFLLTRTKITGLENLPPKGPVILVGNHVAIVETILMLAIPPYLVEMVAAGDLPLEPRFAPIINLYQILPIKRGSMDREGMEMMLDVLKQGGVLGIFPEGGIWETGSKGARSGVAWLSSKAHVPIVPIGFGGMEGALAKALAFKRPVLTMNIGAPLPPVTTNLPGKGRKEALEDAAQQIMERIEALVPPEDRRTRTLESERFDFQFMVEDADGQSLTPEVTITHKEALSKFFHRPVLLDALARNLQRPVQPLQRLDSDPTQIAAATQEILAYLTDENPQFLNYRFGYEAGAAMQAGLSELHALAQWAAARGARLTLKPMRWYRKVGSSAELFEERPGALHHL
ncbi:MAG: 1-acyl-sn-glycerol-3-phosphate acyltransferase [Chloroflexi bacterium]|nr:1-acyl-sn-glycerol-3-phosphate acyltransferase [Chloroflexota bacterium]